MYTYKILKLTKKLKKLKYGKVGGGAYAVVSILGMDLATTRSLSTAENKEKLLIPLPPLPPLPLKENWMFCQLIHKLHEKRLLRQLLVTSHRLI
jgi:hypothetical protein